MTKLICLCALPLLAFLYGQQAPEALVPPFHVVEQEDRIFLADLESQDAAARERAAQAERESLAKLEVRRAVPVAAAVATPIPKSVRVQNVAAAPPRVTSVVKAEGTAQRTEAEPAIPGKVAATDPTRRNIAPEVRRAVPVLSRRASIVVYRGEVSIFPALHNQ